MPKDKKAEAWTRSHVKNPINLTLRSKDQSCVKYGMVISKLTELSYRSDMKTWQKPINMTLRSKVNFELGKWIYVSHLLMVIDPCAKYGKPLSNKKNSYEPDTEHVKNPINLTLRSKFKVASRSWMYVTHRLMVIHYTHVPNMVSHSQIKKKFWAGHDSAQTNGQTAGQTEWFLYTSLNFVHGGYNNDKWRWIDVILLIVRT